MRRQPVNLRYTDPKTSWNNLKPVCQPPNPQTPNASAKNKSSTTHQTPKQKAQFHNESPLTICPPSCADEPAGHIFLFRPCSPGGAVIHMAESSPGLSWGATNGTVCVGDASYGTRWWTGLFRGDVSGVAGVGGRPRGDGCAGSPGVVPDRGVYPGLKRGDVEGDG